MKKKRNIVYSTDENFVIDVENNNREISDNKEANNSTLYLHLQRLPGNRVNTVIKGIENGADMHSICKEFKKKLGVGGSVKNKDIFLQGNHRQRLQKFLSERGFKIKLSGG